MRVAAPVQPPRSRAVKKPVTRRSEPMASRASSLNRLHDSAVLPLKKKLPIKRLVLSLAGLCLAAITIIWLQIRIDALSQQLAGLESARNDLQSRTRLLRQEIDGSISFDDVYRVVNSQYGMDFQSTDRIILEVPDNVLYDNRKR